MNGQKLSSVALMGFVNKKCSCCQKCVLKFVMKVGAVLKLGNITFVPTTNMDGTEGCVISNDYGKTKNLLEHMPMNQLN